MPVKKISEIGSNVIRSKAKKVSVIRSRQLRQLIRDLTDTMRHENLVGIAAPQIGKGLRVFLSEVRKTLSRKSIKKPDKLRVFINPVVISKSKKIANDYEGCGSVAHGGIFGPVKRSASVSVRAEDAHGKKFTFKASGLLARIIQHEMDHLNGTVFIDLVTNTKDLLGREEYIKMKKR
jgi:peptide deformylase